MKAIMKKMKVFIIPKNFVISFIFFAMFIILIFSLFHAFTTKTKVFNEQANSVIVLDAGHGGIDGGAVSGELLEKDVNLDIAKRLQSCLEQKGYSIIMTREEDISLDGLCNSTGSRHQKDLIARKNIINSSKAQLFISIHCNSNIKNPNADGSIVIYNDNYQQNKELADYIQIALNNIIISGNKRSIRDPQNNKSLFVLNYANIPGVMVETSFLTNPKEHELLLKDSFKDQIAEAIANSTEKYLNRTKCTSNNTSKHISGKLALIIDDFGQNQNGMKEMMEINRPLTFAIMPFLEFSEQDAIEAHNRGYEIIVHLPMQSSFGTSASRALGPRPVTLDKSDNEVQNIVKDSLDSVPYAVGMNIHMGAIVSENVRIMTDIMTVLRERGLYFIDSRTSQRTVCRSVAEKLGIKFAERKTFLEHASKTKNYIEKQLLIAGDLAIKQGSAIAIGHVGNEGGKLTAECIKEMIPKLERMGIELVFVSELVK